MAGTKKQSKSQKDASVLDQDNLMNLADWNSLETKFQELNSMLNAPSYGLNASLARQKQKQQVESSIEMLLDMAQAEARRLLIEGDAQASVEGGLRTLKLKEAYYGTGSLQLVPCYFHLARTNQYLDKFKQAEEFLSLAQWNILKHPEADVSLKAELHQTFGLLYASDGKLDLALKQLSQATYFLTILNGPSHVLTSFGYFDLGNVFAATSNMDSAMAFYEKVKDIWYDHLTSVFSEDDIEIEHRAPSSLGDENLQDGLKMIRGIVGLQTERFGLVHPSTGRAELILGLFYRWVGDDPHGTECMARTLEIHKRVYGAQHQSTMKIRQFVTQFGYILPADTASILSPRTEESGSQPQPSQPAPSQPAASEPAVTQPAQAAAPAPAPTPAPAPAAAAAAAAAPAAEPPAKEETKEQPVIQEASADSPAPEVQSPVPEEVHVDAASPEPA
mmetsp:Transcript_61096/g.101185  ORF Transcript_61096/g.101185 Transcript_61096/m.101185 type:complete len:447 (+) Transcript_61096:86-1426(+)